VVPPGPLGPRRTPIEGEGAQVTLAGPEGRSGTISGPYRIVDGDGDTVTPATGAVATFTWRCP
jgi:hypothetical protein